MADFSLQGMFDLASGLKRPEQEDTSFAELIERSKSLKGIGVLGKMLNAINLDGGFRTSSSNTAVELPTGDVSIRNTSLGMGGRAGVSLPIGDNTLDLGMSGFFERFKSELPDELVRFGAPEVVKGRAKRLTGIDAALSTPGGRFSARFDTPHSKERSFRFGFDTRF